MNKVQYYGIVRNMTNCREEYLDFNSIGELMDLIKSKYGKRTLKAAKASLVTMDSMRVEKLSRNIAVSDGSIIAFYPVSCGG